MKEAPELAIETDKALSRVLEKRYEEKQNQSPLLQLSSNAFRRYFQDLIKI